jgi:hypothetical protein
LAGSTHLQNKQHVKSVHRSTKFNFIYQTFIKFVETQLSTKSDQLPCQFYKPWVSLHVRLSTIYGSRALVDLDSFFSFLICTQSVGLLRRGISPSRGRYLHTEQHKHRINAHRHPCLEWDSNPRSQCSRLWFYIPRGSWSLFQFLNLYTVGRTPWTGNQPVSRPILHTGQHKQNKCTQIYMPQVGFEPMFPMFERAKTFHALDRGAIVFGFKHLLYILNLRSPTS